MTQKQVSIALVALAGLITVAGLLAAPATEPEFMPQPQPFDKALAQAYVEAGCWHCHSVSSLESELREHFGEQAPGIRPTGPDLAGVGLRYHPDWHTAHFWQPDAAYAGSQMPAHRDLLDGERLTPRGRQVVDFMLTLKAPGRHVKAWPEARLTAPVGDAKRGKGLFARECAGCHGVDADGNGVLARFFVATRKPAALSKGEFVFMPHNEAPADAIFTHITNGLPGTGMPAFAHRLGEQERADITAWVVKIAPAR